MIVPAPGPLDPAARQLRALYLSLNSPVVALASLPVGPAAAAVAVHAGSAGGATLAIRSARSGGLTFYTVGGDATPLAPEQAAGAALTFAESLGFLFEEVPASVEGGSVLAGWRARERWCAWIGTEIEAEAVPAPGSALRLSKFRGPLPAPAADLVASALGSVPCGAEARRASELRWELASHF